MSISEPDFEGRIGTVISDSAPSWARQARPPRRAPNIVMVVLDDIGFAQLGCYGGDIDTPAIDALAQAGALYRDFHVTALCSPTRACLLSGRNHHAVGMGLVANFDNGFPGYRGEITPRAAILPELLGDVGYATYCVGKWHLVPPRHSGPLGPFGQWPLGRGFDHFYGFLHGKTDQWSPVLWEDNHLATSTRRSQHLSEDLVDRSLEYLADYVTANSERPFFLYLAFGAGHDPHQVPTSHIDRYQGRFNDGWDAARARVLERQRALGVVPDHASIPTANPGVPSWDELTADERRLFARLQEVFAGFVNHTDEQIGRLVDFLRAHGLLDDTVLMVLSDNGASHEGGRDGYIAPPWRAGLRPTAKENLEHFDDLGGPKTQPMYPSGWAQAGNTPLRYYKLHTHGGGIRAPMIVHWPRRLARSGAIGTQYHHVVDVVPTLLEELGVSAPEIRNGVEQMPIHGTSMAYTFDDPDAPTRKKCQYYEINGHRGLWMEGWKALTLHTRGAPFDMDRWELYHVAEDFSETIDLAEEFPDKLDELVKRWREEAEVNGVFPLEDRMITLTGNPDAEPKRDKTSFTFLPGTFLPDAASCPDIFNRHFAITAVVEPYREGDYGLLLAMGDRFGGVSLFVQDRCLHFDYNAAGVHSATESPPLPMGTTELTMELTYHNARTADVRLAADGQTMAEGQVSPLMITGVSLTGVQCGQGWTTAVCPRYDNPYPYSGALRVVRLDLGPKEDDADEIAFAAVMRDQ